MLHPERHPDVNKEDVWRGAGLCKGHTKQENKDCHVLTT